MSYVTIQPPALETAAGALSVISTTLTEAVATAAAPTTGLLMAAADEVSTAIADFFSAYGQDFQSISAEVSALYEGLVSKLTATADYYANAEAANAAQLVQSATAGLYTPPMPSVVPPAFLQNTAIVMGGTGMPMPTPDYLRAINNLFVQPMQPGAIVSSLFTPEQLYPITGVRSLIFATSVEQGLQILNTAVWEQINAANHVTVFGYSQSAVISSLLMQHYISIGALAPDPAQLNFILTGNEMNPNGGILARLPGLNIPTIGLPFYGAMPDGPYQTTTYTLEYDGFADFPRYPLNILSDINAVLGILTVHTTYPTLTPEQIASATLLPTTGATANEWYIIAHPDLPLLDPLRALPVIGDPLAALIQPDLKVIVNLGYGDPNFGYSTSPANVATPFGLFPNVPAHVIADALLAGTQQGINDFASALPTAVTNAPAIEPLANPPLLPQNMPPPHAPLALTPVNVANTLAAAVSTGYSVLLPTTDLLTSFVTTLPAYNLTLALSQLAQGNVVAAVELPLAATAGLAALGGMLEFIAVFEAISSILQQLQSFTV